jgi:hypothetical protein
MEMSPFDYVKAICETKRDLLKEDPQCEKEFGKSIWTVNKALSYYPDCIMQANAMNTHYDAPPRWKFDFFLNSISKKKRFSKWAEKDNDESLKLVKEYYGYSSEKAKEALRVLSEKDLIMIKEKLYKGGK